MVLLLNKRLNSIIEWLPTVLLKYRATRVRKQNRPHLIHYLNLARVGETAILTSHSF
jgi:hypothetical protein